MLAARVPKRSAEGLRNYLKKKGLLDSKYRLFGSGEFIYFPLVSHGDVSLDKNALPSDAKLTEARFEAQSRVQGERPRQGYELYGSVAVIECEPHEAKAVARSLLRTNGNIKTVLRKGGAVSGRYRTRRFIHVLGPRNCLVEYRENGCVFRFDLRKVFFSTKLAYERKRIAGLARNGEKVVVMFAGVGPFAIEMAKTHRKSRVIAIELNGAACAYLKGNISLNKTPNVAVEHGDAKRYTGKYAGVADRIVMPLPKEAYSYLGTALRMAKRKCAFHYYTFSKSSEADLAVQHARELVRAHGRRFRLLGVRTVRPYSATDEELAIDFLTY